MQRESWQPRRRRRHRQQPDSRPANGHPMCDRSAYLLQNIPPSTSYTLSLLKKRLGDGASCINRDSARRRHNQLLMETVGLLNLRNNLMSRGEQARGCPACRDPDTINRYWTSIFRFLSASLTAETDRTCLQKQRINLEGMRTDAFFHKLVSDVEVSRGLK